MTHQQPRRTVLFIDDEEPARTLVKLLLEQEGYRVVTASNGEEGVRSAKTCHPDVVLLDVVMPKLNGHEALQRLKVDLDTCEIPIIMLTAKGAEQDIAASYALGAAFHVEKPFASQDLLEKIERVVSQGNRTPRQQTGPANRRHPTN